MAHQQSNAAHETLPNRWDVQKQAELMRAEEARRIGADLRRRVRDALGGLFAAARPVQNVHRTSSAVF